MQPIALDSSGEVVSNVGDVSNNERIIKPRTVFLVRGRRQVFPCVLKPFTVVESFQAGRSARAFPLGTPMRARINLTFIRFTADDAELIATAQQEALSGENKDTAIGEKKQDFFLKGRQAIGSFDGTAIAGSE